MKVGTDGVLLGAWSSVSDFPDSILDIGAGTGVVSLMLAQRSDAKTIDAVELDENAYAQTVENFERSNWGDRLYCYHSSFQEFANEIAANQETYDLIVSNPPFYSDSFETENFARNKARSNSFLSFEELLEGVVNIISKNGKFVVVLPFVEEDNFIRLAAKNKLFLNRVCRVQGNLSSEIKRTLLEFSPNQTVIKEEHLIIELARHQYTEAYINLTKDFYLKM